MNLHSRMLTIAVLAASLTSTGCLFRSHKVQSNMSHVPLQEASQTQLVNKLNALANAIQTMNAAVEISTTVGGVKKGTVTEYSNITGFILAEKPSMLRMIGQFPIVKNRAFDMVSNAQGFELWIPAKNRFIIGPSEVTKPSANALENLRPHIIMDALLFNPIQADEIAVLETRVFEIVGKDSQAKVEQSNYILDIIEKDAVSGQWHLSRKVYFDRTDLLPHRQLVFNKQGDVATDARYNDFKDFQGILFPSNIRIQRIEEEYTIGLRFTKLTLNGPLQPDQFLLVQPPGAQVVRLNGNQEPGSTSATHSANAPR